MPKAASRLSNYFEKHTVSRLSRFINTRCVPFNRSTWLVHIVRSDRCSMPRMPSRLDAARSPCEVRSDALLMVRMRAVALHRRGGFVKMTLRKRRSHATLD